MLDLIKFRIKLRHKKTDNCVEWLIRFGIELRDIWVGVSWDREERAFQYNPDWNIVDYDVHVCFFPCLPIHVRYTTHEFLGD